VSGLLVVLDVPGRAPLEVPAQPGTRVLDLCDEHPELVPFSCRSASCGTCRVDVLEGGDLLDPPADEELDVLGIFGDDPSRRRLACQIRVRADAGAGRVCVRPADD
jgi:ferredoxin